MQLNINNINEYVENNKLLEVNSPYVLGSDGLPDPHGIFSYEIFGHIGTEERAKTMAYIDLKRRFIHPMIYNAIYQMYHLS